MGCQFRNFVFTSFKEELIPNMEKFEYVIMGREICPDTGRHHLQGYAETKNAMRLNGIKEALGDNSAHIEKRRGNQKQAIDYCKKDGDYTELGEPKRQGRRADLEKAAEEFIAGEKRHDQIVLDNPCIYAQYHRGLDKLEKSARRERQRDKTLQQLISPLNKNQSDVLDIAQNMNRRNVLWIIDREGGKGKSYLTTWMEYNRNALTLNNTDYKNSTYLYLDQDYVIFDLPRETEHINYGTIEAFTNLSFNSTKYEPEVKHCHAKVIVFSNNEPEITKLSADRWIIHSWNEIN